jgi:predicted N-formylglutamate amidohydrolase
MLATHIDRVEAIIWVSDKSTKNMLIIVQEHLRALLPKKYELLKLREEKV